MTIFLKYNTASQEVLLGPFLDDTDGKTAETGLTIANTDIKIWKNGGTTESSKNSGGATHIASGRYYAVLDATDTNTVGPLMINVAVAGALPVRLECLVLPALVFDSLISGSDNLQVDAVQMSGTTLTARDIGASVLLSSGTGTGQISLSSGAVTAGTVSDKTGYALSQSFPSNFASLAINGSGHVILQDASLVTAKLGTFALAKTTNITGFNDIAATAIVSSGAITTSSGAVSSVTTVGTTTNLTNAPTSGDFTATMKTSIGTAVAASAVASVTGNVGGNVVGSVGSVTGAVGSVTATVNANLTQIIGTTLTQTSAGYLAAGFKKLFDVATPVFTLAAVNQTGDSFARIGATGSGLTSLAPASTALSTATWTGTKAGYLDAAMTSRMATYTQPTGFLAATFPTGTIANTTNITAGTITTVTTLTNLPAITTDWLSAAGVSAAAVTKIQSGLSTYAGGDTSGVTTLLGRVTGAVLLASGYTAPDNAGIAAVKSVTDLLPDAGALSSLATSAALATVDSNVDAILVDTGTTLPATLADMSGATFDTATDSLEAIRNRGDAAWVGGGGSGDATEAKQDAIIALIGTPSGASVSVDIAAVKSDTAGTKAKTDNLPSDPADASDIAAAFGTVNGTLSAIAGYIDTEIASIITKLGTPAGSSLADDISAVKGDTTTTLSYTGKLDAMLSSDGFGGSRWSVSALTNTWSVNGRILDMPVTVSAISTGAITADAIASDAVAEIQSGLATATALASVATDTGTTIPAAIAALDFAVAGDAMALTSGERNITADAILLRGASNTEATAGQFTLTTAILRTTGKNVRDVGGDTLTTYRTDGTTTHLQVAIDTDADAEPVTEVG